MVVPGVALAGELLLLPVLLVPFGDLLLRLGERWLGLTLRLTLPERGLLAFYAAGGTLYLAAYLPLGLFLRAVLPYLLGALIVLGWAIWGLRSLPEGRTRGALRAPWERTLPSGGPATLAVLGALTVGLLAFEIAMVGGQALPNTFDGSVQTDFVALLLQQGSAPTTLQPLAPMGVIYPQGTAVWLATAVALFGWPVAESPSLLPPLFLALSVVGAFCWGQRLFGVDRPRGARAGLVFAAGAALLFTWPRFLVGGSYDFVFALPLFLVLLGWAGGRATALPSSWRELAALGLGGGIVASMSPVPAEFLVLLLGAGELLRPGFPWVRRLGGVLRALVVGGLAALFELPSILGMLFWWPYPGHVLTPTGGPLPPRLAGPNPLGSFVGLSDPFLFRPQDVWLSPFLSLKIEIALLLTVGLVLVGIRLVPRAQGIVRRVPSRVARHLALGVLVGLVVLFAATVGASRVPALRSAAALTSVSEVSILLFMVYGGIAAVPLVLAADAVQRSAGAASPRPSTPPRNRGRVRRASRGALRASGEVRRALPLLVAFGLLITPMTTGAVEMVGDAPTFLHAGIVEKLANVSSGDLDALAWSAAHLPPCSGVLVAPGSAGQFLPGFDPDLRVVFPMNPAPANFSYSRAVADLSAGYLNATTLADLQALGVTEVLVTGRSNLLWEPFQTGELLASHDFTVAFHEDDAWVFVDTPGAAALVCYPVS